MSWKLILPFLLRYGKQIKKFHFNIYIICLEIFLKTLEDFEQLDEMFSTFIFYII